ncbi:MAG TPA: cytosine permease [Gaiellaceae bacterium]|nr:cytosine permease [Gaiellaceae bacterium]
MPAVEEFGVEPIPAELRTAGWRDLFAINFTFFLNPVMYLLGAFAVVDGGLPLWWAVAAMVAGQALAFALLVIVAQPGVDYGLPGQVGMRASLGYWGARLLSSPYRVIASTYWFAAQALTAGLGAQAIFEAMTGRELPLVPLALVFALIHATFAVLGFDVMRWVLRVVLPVSLAFTGILVGLFLASDDPEYAVGRVFDSPEQSLTWVGFATYVTVMCGASLTFVTNVADVCRYTPTRWDMRVGLFASALTSAVVTTFVGGYAAAATGEVNPFVAVADLTSNDLLLAVLLLAIVIQGLAANITNVYTAGLSIVNTIPRLGRLWGTIAAAAAAIVLSAFPDFVNNAEAWVTHLGNLAAPLTGAVLADYLVVKRQRIDVGDLFDSQGGYRYVKGVNIYAVVAVVIGVTAYYVVPQSWIKVVWGVSIAAAAYLLLLAVPQVTTRDRSGMTSQRPKALS